MNADAFVRAGRREWVGLGVIALPCLLYSMDLTVLDLAVPRISADLRPTSAQLLWIMDIYGFVLASCLIPMGTLGDRIGRRRLLLIGAASFGVASVIAAFSKSAGMLIAARAALGVAGATLAPSTLSLIRNMFTDPKQRTFAIGVWITSYSAGGVIGPLLGGVLLNHFWWGSVFLIGVPVMVLLLVLGPVLLPEFRDPSPRRIDLHSVLLSLAAVLLVIYGIKQIAQGATSWWPTLSIASGLVIGVVFIRRQQTLADPLIDLKLFRIRTFSTALAAYALGTFVLFGFFLFTTQYLQLVLGFSPLRAGLWMLPTFGAFIAGSLLTPLVSRRIHRAQLLSAGLVVSAIGFWIVAGIGVTSGLVALVTGSTIYALGLSPVFTLTTDTIVSAAPPERAGVASALSETGSELGGALGIAILGSIGTAIYRTGLAHSAPHGISVGASNAASSTLGAAIAVAQRLPASVGTHLTGAAREAFIQSLDMTALICAVVALATAIALAILLRERPSPRRVASRHADPLGRVVAFLIAANKVRSNTAG
ncbi:MAG TPA: MFS transporter [Gemmatimonadaceae bacterium]|nr:MFS transporter [Gemmatimonadaceae bacterium]